MGEEGGEKKMWRSSLSLLISNSPLFCFRFWKSRSLNDFNIRLLGYIMVSWVLHTFRNIRLTDWASRFRVPNQYPTCLEWVKVRCCNIAHEWWSSFKHAVLLCSIKSSIHLIRTLTSPAQMNQWRVFGIIYPFSLVHLTCGCIISYPPGSIVNSYMTLICVTHSRGSTNGNGVACRWYIIRIGGFLWTHKIKKSAIFDYLFPLVNMLRKSIIPRSSSVGSCSNSNIRQFSFIIHLFRWSSHHWVANVSR